MKFNEQTLIEEHLAVAKKYGATLRAAIKLLGDIYMDFVSHDVKTAKRIKDTRNNLIKESTANDKDIKIKTEKHSDVSKEVRGMEGGKLPRKDGRHEA